MLCLIFVFFIDVKPLPKAVTAQAMLQYNATVAQLQLI